MSTSDEFLPYLLYRVDGEQARFATWAVADGHESLAVFTASDAAGKYGTDLADGNAWTVYQPPREQLIEILKLCQRAGIVYAALDPIGGNARTLFEISKVLEASGS